MDSLAFAIGQEEAELKGFVAALTEEQGALTSGNTDLLSGIINKKNKNIETLARLGHQRNLLLKTRGFPDDREGLEAWAKAANQQTLVSGFLYFVDEAKELNRLNGQLIAMRLTSTQTALAALAPERAAGQGLYGPKGQTKFTTGYRLIDTV